MTSLILSSYELVVCIKSLAFFKKKKVEHNKKLEAKELLDTATLLQALQASSSGSLTKPKSERQAATLSAVTRVLSSVTQLFSIQKTPGENPPIVSLDCQPVSENLSQC